MTAAGAAAAHPGAGGQALMSIGEVLSHLRADFPDATISKLRFLEAEGLVEPQRTPAGYRKYTWADVARLRYVLVAQRDHYLPLRVIREHLAAIPAVEDLPRPRLPLAAVGEPGTPPGAEGHQPRLGRAELLIRSGIDDTMLGALEQHGLIRPGPGGWYDSDAVAVAAAAAELARHGLEPRHLRAYRVAADREVGLYAQLVAPLARQSDPGARARAAETVRELVALSQRMHGALIRAGLRDTLRP